MLNKEELLKLLVSHKAEAYDCMLFIEAYMQKKTELNQKISEISIALRDLEEKQKSEK